jgi:hypothetical protein
LREIGGGGDDDDEELIKFFGETSLNNRKYTATAGDESKYFMVVSNGGSDWCRLGLSGCYECFICLGLLNDSLSSPKYVA